MNSHHIPLSHLPGYEDKPTKDKIEHVINQFYNETLYTIDEETHNMIKIPYDADRAAQLSGFLSDGIRSKLRNLNFSNYKYFVQVVIGEKKDQSVHIATRHFFDEMVDTWGSASFQSDTLYCTTVAYGIFQSSSSSSNDDQIGIESEPMDSSLHL